MATKKDNNRYAVAPGSEGVTVWATPPAYERKDGGRFVLKGANQRDLKYLYNHVKSQHVIDTQDESEAEQNQG